MVVSLHVQSFLPLAEAAQTAVGMVRDLELLLTTDNMEGKGCFNCMRSSESVKKSLGMAYYCCRINTEHLETNKNIYRYIYLK